MNGSAAGWNRRRVIAALSLGSRRDGRAVGMGIADEAFSILSPLAVGAITISLVREADPHPRDSPLRRRRSRAGAARS